MTTSKRTLAAITFLVTGICLAAWVMLLLNPGGLLAVHHCAVSDAGPSPASLKMLLDMNPIGPLLTGWVLMVVAMMLPKLIIPIEYICERSFRQSRPWQVLLFTGGYIGVWTIAGIFMISLILGFNLLLPKSYLPAIITGLVTLVWQFSPLKQRCLNRGHFHPPIAAFGWAAGRDALKFGLLHGCWCVAGGWAMMLLPMLLPAGHNLAMIFVTFFMLSEHLEHPQPPRWRFTLRGKLFRILYTRSQTKLRALFANG